MIRLPATNMVRSPRFNNLLNKDHIYHCYIRPFYKQSVAYTSTKLTYISTKVNVSEVFFFFFFIIGASTPGVSQFKGIYQENLEEENVLFTLNVFK